MSFYRKGAVLPTAPALTAISLFCAMSLLACSAEAETAVAADESGSDQTGTLETSQGTYVFTPRSCGIYEEDGEYDILIAGSGSAPDGEVFHLDLSSSELTIDLGVDEPFKTSERQIRAGDYISQPLTLEVSGRTVSASSVALVDERGQSIDPDARLHIDCSL